MKTIEKDMENINKFLNDLAYCKDCITDIQTRINNNSFMSDNEILDEVRRAIDFLIDAEKHLKKAMI